MLVVSETLQQYRQRLCAEINRKMQSPVLPLYHRKGDGVVYLDNIAKVLRNNALHPYRWNTEASEFQLLPDEEDDMIPMDDECALNFFTIKVSRELLFPDEMEKEIVFEKGDVRKINGGRVTAEDNVTLEFEDEEKRAITKVHVERTYYRVEDEDCEDGVTRYFEIYLFSHDGCAVESIEDSEVFGLGYDSDDEIVPLTRSMADFFGNESGIQMHA